MHATTDVVQVEVIRIMLLHGTILILMAMANAQGPERIGFADPGTDTCCPDDIDDYLRQLQTSHGVGTEPMSYTLGNEHGVCCHIDRGLPDTELVTPIFSSSKLVGAHLMMQLVTEGIFSGGDSIHSNWTKCRDVFPWWTQDPTDPRYDVNILHLVSQSDGFGDIVYTLALTAP